EFPVDRHVFAKRARVWVNADGFITPLEAEDLNSFENGPPAVWRFNADAGNGRYIEIEMTADMLEQRNTTVLRFSQPARNKSDKSVHRVSLTVRIDIEDRSFHSQTHRHPGSDHHFSTHCRPLEGQCGFLFAPASDRQLRVFSDSGLYHHESEWCENIPHPIEESRGQVASGDAYSPGWFELPLPEDRSVSVVLCADPVDPPADLVQEIVANRLIENKLVFNRARLPQSDDFGRRLALAARAFVVRRGPGKTIIAG